MEVARKERIIGWKKRDFILSSLILIKRSRIRSVKTMTSLLTKEKAKHLKKAVIVT